MKFLQKLHANRKLQIAVVVSVATLLLVVGWQLEGKNVSTELPLQKTNALAEIQLEAGVVQSARDNYLKAIGKGNGGAYDEYQNALICEANLNSRVGELKNLRAEYQRLISEIDLREREMRVAAAVAKFEEEATTIMTETIDENGIALLEEREAQARGNFEKIANTLKNCLENFKTWEKCEAEKQNLLLAKESYFKEVNEIENLIKEKQEDAKKKLEALQEKAEEAWYEKEKTNDKKISNLLNKIQAKNLKAGLGDGITYESDGLALTTTLPDSTLNNTIGAAINNTITAVGTPLIAGANILGGALKAGDSVVNEILDGLGLGGTNSDAVGSGVLNGPGAIKGLETFEKSYKGNTYGSAIGMITGWTNFLLPFVGAIAIAAIVYAGFLYLTAAGSDEQVGKAKKIIIWVVIGIIVIFSAYAIVNTLLGSSSGGGDNETSISVGGLDVNF
ncbi:hypothetical protein K9N08_00970 [Candidatus Gracilibacteria bacterium]|nr:hypothetical protein [Candidatus Gracilibacteria bacterium]MCF7896534.1 hypothetical protein [Candidatus Gracilibacteria bacterium]